jgi:hypothetical protein
MNCDVESIIGRTIDGTAHLVAGGQIGWQTARRGIIKIINDLSDKHPDEAQDIRRRFEIFIHLQDNFARFDHARRHMRVYPNIMTVELSVDGSKYSANVENVSVSGVCLSTPCRPDLGSEVGIGSRRIVVVRHHEEGIAGRFVDLLSHIDQIETLMQ